MLVSNRLGHADIAVTADTFLHVPDRLAAVAAATSQPWRTPAGRRAEHAGWRCGIAGMSGFLKSWAGRESSGGSPPWRHRWPTGCGWPTVASNCPRTCGGPARLASAPQPPCWPPVGRADVPPSCRSRLGIAVPAAPVRTRSAHQRRNPGPSPSLRSTGRIGLRSCACWRRRHELAAASKGPAWPLPSRAQPATGRAISRAAVGLVAWPRV